MIRSIYQEDIILNVHAPKTEFFLNHILNFHMQLKIAGFYKIFFHCSVWKKVKVLVVQWCLTRCDPWTVAHQVSLSMGILQARILKWVAMSSSRGPSQPRDPTQGSCTAGDSLPAEPPGKPKSTEEGSLSLLQGIYPGIKQISCIVGRFFTNWATDRNITRTHKYVYVICASIF